MNRGEYLERKRILKSRIRWRNWIGIFLLFFFWWTVIAIPIPIGFWLVITSEKTKKQLKELENEREQWELEQWSAVGAGEAPGLND